MKKFYRINEEKMNVLAMYMDDEVREAMHFRFAPCTNEEFVVQVLLRGGISKETVEEVLNIELEDLERTFIIIDSIKACMYCSNTINFMEKIYPNRNFVTEQSEKGRRYRQCLDCYCNYIERFRNEIPGFRVLSDLEEEFQEIDVYLDSAYLFYKWDGVII